MEGDTTGEVLALIAGIEEALVNRQALLLGQDAGEPRTQERIDSLGARIEALLDRLAALYPPDESR